MSVELLAILVAVAALSMFLTWVLARSRSIGLDHPKKHSMHLVPKPRLGGVAIVAAGTCGVLLAAWRSGRPPDDAVLGALTCLIGIFLCFILEDVVGVSWRTRLAIQSVGAGVFLIVSRTWQVSQLLVVSDVATVVVGLVLLIGLVWVMNLYNFMDGLDGLAGGMSAGGFSTLAILAFLTGNEWVGIVSAAVAAAALGFLVFNCPPARIFLGDSGSVPLGFLGGCLGLILVQRRAVSPVVPLLVFAPFVIEATTTILIRAFKGGRVWESHRQHWYQRMILAGWTSHRVLPVYYVLIILSGAAALSYQFSSDTGRILIVVALLSAHAVLPFLAAASERNADSGALHRSMSSI